MEKRLDRIICIMENIFQLLLVKFNNEQISDKPLIIEQSASIDYDLHDQLLSAQEVMSLLNIGTSTYYRFIKKGILKPIIVSKRHYYPKSQIKELLSLPKYKYR